MDEAKLQAHGFCTINDTKYPWVFFTFEGTTDDDSKVAAYFDYFSLLLHKDTSQDLRIMFDLRKFTQGSMTLLQQQREFSTDHKSLYRQRLVCTTVVAASPWTRWAIQVLFAWQKPEMPNRVVSSSRQAVEWMTTQKSMDSI